jgi:hypothetical protein
MKADVRWLEWGSGGETFEQGSKVEPSKPSKTNFEGFEGSTFSQVQSFSPLEAEPAAYEEAFHQWMQERCVFRDRAWGGVGALHRDYAIWCDHGCQDVPAGLPTFEKLLREEGFVVTEHRVVYGLLLAEDLDPGVPFGASCSSERRLAVVGRGWRKRFT